jgi:uncharacterized protein YvpB
MKLTRAAILPILGFILAGLFLSVYLFSGINSKAHPAVTGHSADDALIPTLVQLGIQQTRQASVNFRETHSVNPAAVEVNQPAPGKDITPQPSGEGIPEEHFIWNIWGHRQFFDIGCEASAARDWAHYFGVEVHESNFQFQLPASDNPDFGFVGSVTDPWGQVPPYSYGVHAYPIANLLRSYYGMNARGVKGFTLEQLKTEIAADRPVIAWVIGNVVGGVPFAYSDKEGRQVIVAAYEHVVIVTGYTGRTIRYMNNGRFYDIPYENFENSWQVLGNMVVYLEK